MGTCTSKSKSYKHDRPSITTDTTNGIRNNGEFLNNGEFTIQSIHRDDLMDIKVIEQHLKDNTPKFILNNIIMSIQFFTNHKETIEKLIKDPISQTEKEMNKILLKAESVECIYPDVIMDEVNKNVVYKTMDVDSFSENILAKRIYVINDLIEVVNTNEVPQYTSIDRPCYQVRTEESVKKGFLKLLHIQDNIEIRNNNNNQNEYEENYEPLPGPSSRSDSEYGYITNLNIPKPLSDITTTTFINCENDSIPKRRYTLPETCFVSREVKYNPIENLNNDNDMDDEERTRFLANLDASDFLKTVVYINSKEFMKYFQNVYRCSLGKSLGFNDENISVRVMPGKIFCDDINEENKQVKLFQVIPAVSILWPRDQTIEFVERDDRPTITDIRTGIKYRWPTDCPGGMVDEIIKLTAVLVPKGFHTKKGEKHIDSNLEWEIHFPKAERYLEARMSHAQMKCYIILLILHKTFIEPVTYQQGLRVEHIRTHMYWECERNYKNWPEHFLGIKILDVIENLKQKLYKNEMLDFFIKDRNLFENIPKNYLLVAQQIFMKILCNPLPYFIYALRNVRYTNGKFYPPLNYEELYKMISTKQTAAVLNPKLLPVEKIHYFKPRIYKDPEQQAAHLKELRNREKVLTQRLKDTQKNDETGKKDEDIINLDVVVGKTIDTFQLPVILPLFIKNFIDTAIRSSSLSTSKQALFYLKQAYYLTTILKKKSPASIEDCIEFFKIISDEEIRIKKKSFRSGSFNSDTRPLTPTRNSTSFKFDPIQHNIRKGSPNLANTSQLSHSNSINKSQTTFGPETTRGTTLKSALQKNNSFTQGLAFGDVQKKRTVGFVS